MPQTSWAFWDLFGKISNSWSIFLYIVELAITIVSKNLCSRFPYIKTACCQRMILFVFPNLRCICLKECKCICVHTSIGLLVCACWLPDRKLNQVSPPPSLAPTAHRWPRITTTIFYKELSPIDIFHWRLTILLLWKIHIGLFKSNQKGCLQCHVCFKSVALKAASKSQLILLLSIRDALL